MSDRYRFNLVGVNVEARNEDHVFLAILYVHEALSVHAAHVTGSEPAIGQHDLGSFVWTVPIALHHLGTAHANLADLPDLQAIASVVFDHDIGGGDRQPDRTVELSVGGIYASGGGGLRQSPCLRESSTGGRLPTLRYGGLYRHTAAQSDFKPAEVDGVETGGVKQSIEESVDAADV